MIQLTEKVFAVEVPSDAYNLRVSPPYNGWPAQLSYETKIYTTEGTLSIDGKLINDKQVRLIGVTPLSEEQAELIVEWVEEEQYYRDYRKDGWQGDIPAIQSFATLLESKGLDVNKKYAIMKIE